MLSLIIFSMLNISYEKDNLTPDYMFNKFFFSKDFEFFVIMIHSSFLSCGRIPHPRRGFNYNSTTLSCEVQSIESTSEKKNSNADEKIIIKLPPFQKTCYHVYDVFDGLPSSTRANQV
jgi:hypothetical protein